MSQDQVFQIYLYIALPALIGVVAFFVARLVRTLDRVHNRSYETKTQIEIMKKDLERIKEDQGVLKRDQVAIWRKVDFIRKETCSDINPPKSRQ